MAEKGDPAVENVTNLGHLRARRRRTPANATAPKDAADGKIKVEDER